MKEIEEMYCQSVICGQYTQISFIRESPTFFEYIIMFFYAAVV